MIHKLLTIAGVFCLLCAAFPLIGYRIFNMGVFVLLAAGLAFILLPRFWGKIAALRPLRNFLVAAIVVALVYSVSVSALMMHRAYLNYPPDSGECAVIVLGSKINGDAPSLMLRRRLNVAGRYLNANPDAICVVTGGQGKDEAYSEALVMKNYLVGIGIAADRIIMEEKSTSTRENIRFASELMPKSGLPVVICTDSFHQLRANIFASAEGVRAYGLSALTPWGLLPAYWVRDMLGVAVAWAQTR